MNCWKSIERVEKIVKRKSVKQSRLRMYCSECFPAFSLLAEQTYSLQGLKTLALSPVEQNAFSYKISIPPGINFGYHQSIWNAHGVTISARSSRSAL